MESERILQDRRITMKVLVSAYACEPGKGSDPEVCWQWAGYLQDCV